MDKQQILQKVNLFKALSNEELDELSPFIKSVHLPAKTKLIDQGKHADGMYIIKKGKVQVNVRLPGNIENKIAVLKDFDFFGEVIFIDGGITTASIVTLTDTEFYFFSREHFQGLQTCKPALTYKICVAISDEVCKRLRQINNDIIGNLVDIKKSISRFAKPNLSKPVPASFAALTACGINIDFLMTLGIFKHFNTSELAELLTYMQLRKADKKEIVFKESDKSTKTFYVVVQGAVQMVLAKVNKLAKLSVIGPGNICGQLSYLDDKTGSAIGIAREDVVLLEINFSGITILKEKNSELFYKWYNAVSQPFVSMLRVALKDLTRLATHLHN